VPSLQTGAYRRAVVEQVGAFDESLAVVEDVDFNTRVARAGYRLLLDPSIRFWYVPRASLGALWRQIHGVGRIKVAVLAKHPDIVRAKYLTPGAFVLVFLASGAAVLAGWATGARGLAIAGSLLPVFYATLVVGFAASRTPKLGPAAVWLLAIVPVLHIGYGTGFLLGLGGLLRRLKRSPSSAGVPASSAGG
jgi:cellulose synthase/poly-beta-1,6-N-acetylglucosamine synthase-like glycosyltransferase